MRVVGTGQFFDGLNFRVVGCDLSVTYFETENIQFPHRHVTFTRMQRKTCFSHSVKHYSNVPQVLCESLRVGDYVVNKYSGVAMRTS